MKENRNDNGILSIYTLIWPFSIGRDKSTGKSNNFKSEPQARKIFIKRYVKNRL